MKNSGQPTLSDNAGATGKKYSGIVFWGIVDTYTDANNCAISGLAGRGDGLFEGYYLWVVRDSGGAGAAPQGEKARVTGYTSVGGLLTHEAFTTPLAADDEVLLLHPILVEAISGGGSGDIEIFDSFEYPTVASLRAAWTEGGGAGDPTRSGTAYEGQYSMQTVVAGSVGQIHRLLATRNMKTLANIGIASQSSAGGDTFRFTLYDSSGNHSYFTQTCNIVADTWTYHNINPHSTPDGSSATPADLSDVVEIRMANLTVGSTYKFDFIKFSSLVSSIIGAGYDGLSDSADETSSVRGQLLLIRDELSDAGITTFPPAADIGNGVSIAEAVRAILTSVVGGDDYDAYTNISGSANASMDAIAQKFAVLLAADGANTFGPNIQGAAKTDLELALYALARYFATDGAAISATVDPGGSTRATLELILEDIGQMLAGGAGITTFPAGVAPGDGVSMAEAIRYASEEVDSIRTSTDKLAGGETEGTASAQNLYAGTATSGETGADILTLSTTTRKKLHALLVNMTNCTAGATVSVRMYTKVLNGGSMEKFYDQDYVKGTDPDVIPIVTGTFGIRNDVQVEMQSDNSSDTSKDVTWSYITEDAE